MSFQRSLAKSRFNIDRRIRFYRKMIQFAKDGLERGMNLIDATLEGAKLRFRPIVMTSLAFGFGVLPLAISTGAGAGAQNAIGTGVLGGMVTATVLVLIFSPLFYVLIEKFMGKQARKEAGTSAFRGWMEAFSARFKKHPPEGPGTERTSGDG